MNKHKHPLISVGFDFVALPFDWCNDVRSFDRGFKLFIQLSVAFCGLVSFQ